MQDAKPLATPAFKSSRQGIGKGLPVLSLMDCFPGFYALWICIHLLGLTAAWLVRMYAGHRLEGWICLAFLATMPLIAVATVVGQQVCLSLWPLSACTLAIMIVAATVDFGVHDSIASAGDASN